MKDKKVWDFDKFWIIWSTCLDKPRAINEVQKAWHYEGNALYQTGIEKPIWQEMVEGNFLEEKGIIRKRGVTGKLLYSKMEWLSDFLDPFFESLLNKNNNSLPSELYNCFENKDLFIKFLNQKRTHFFFIDKLKALFGNKENI